jgi:predicted metalloendopeptidase
VDHLYVEEYFKSGAKDTISQMVENIRVGMRQIINEDDWLADETKKYALRKLDRMRKIVGMTQEVEDTNKLDQLYDRLALDSAADSFRQMAIKGFLFIYSSICI